jgi:predicted permease
MPDFRELVRKKIAHLRLEGSQESQIVDELAADLEQRYHGLTDDEAERAVACDLEGFSVARKVSPPAIGSSKRGNLMMGLMHDVKVAWRMLRTRPSFAAAVVAMLAVGIGGNTAIFSIFNTLMLRPLPFRDAGQLIDADETAPKWNLEFVGINNFDYFGWRDGNSTLQSLAAFTSGGGNFSDSSGTLQRINLAPVTANMLDTLGLRPALGRNFTQEEDRPKAPAVIMLGYDLWQTFYHADPAAIGRVIKVNARPTTIIGVLPPEAIWPAQVDAWVPLGAELKPSPYSLRGVGRLKPGVTIQQAQADLLRLHRNAQEAHHDTAPTSPIMTPLRDRALGDLKTVTRILFGAVALVLLVACVNIAGLMLVRGEARSREVAIRAAIGASRGAIVRQFLTESLLLAFAGGVAGVLLGSVGLHALVAMIPSGVPKWLRFDMDWRFTIFAVALTGAAAMLFGAVPALQAASTDVRGCVQEMSRSTLTRAKNRILNVLAASEIALAVVLLAGAALVIEAFQKALHVDPGFRSASVLTWALRLPFAKYSKPEQVYPLYSAMLDGVRQIPGVNAASGASNIPLSGHQGFFFEAEGSPHGPAEQKPVTLHITALPGYFETLGVTFLAGRPFEARDEAPGAPKVAIVNESFAKYYWPGQDAVGKRIHYSGAKVVDWFEVVGLTKDTKHYGLDQEMKPCVFVPFHVLSNNGMFMVARTSSDPETISRSVREIARRLDPDLPIFDVQTLISRVDRSLWTRRVYSWLFGTFAAVAVLLAAAGIYGVISFGVSQRTREIGIRMALGARPEQVMASVLGRGMLLVALGVVFGTVAALFTSHLIESLLFGVTSRQAATYALVIAAIALVGAAANYIPARRAAGVDPMRALRSE